MKMKLSWSRLLELSWKIISLCVWHVIKYLRYNFVEWTYPEWAHWTLVKLLWQIFWKRRRKQNKVDIYEACESTRYEYSAKDKVENDKENSVGEDADLFTNKDMENKKIMREEENIKIGSPQYEREFGKGHWSQYDFMSNVNEQQDDKKKHLNL